MGGPCWKSCLSGKIQKPTFQTLLETHPLRCQGKLFRKMSHQGRSTPKPVKEDRGGRCWLLCATDFHLCCRNLLGFHTRTRNITSYVFPVPSIVKALVPGAKETILRAQIHIHRTGKEDGYIWSWEAINQNEPHLLLNSLILAHIRCSINI